MKRAFLMISLAAAVLCGACQTEPKPFGAYTDKPDGLYSSAEDDEIVFSYGDYEGPLQVQASVSGNARDVQTVENDGNETVVPVPDHPAWITYQTLLTDKNGSPKGKIQRVGAFANADKVKPGTDEPADFDAFWADQIAKMKKIPLKPVLEEVTVKDPKYAGKIRSWKFKLDCGEGNTAYGYISMPVNAKPGTLPAILQVFGAGTFGCSNPPAYYALNSIHVTLSPHMTECGKDGKYYAQKRKELSGYPKRNADDREKYYMKGMILRVVRTLQFIEEQKEWNGKDLLTHGESQGGFQAIAGAALDPKVSFCLAMVPAMSDHLAYRNSLSNGWPYVLEMDPKTGKPKDTEFNKKAEKVLPYFDNVNFAKRIKCEVWISTGLLDTTCPPNGVFAVYNSLPPEADKHLYVDQNAGHNAGCRTVVDRLHSIVVPPAE